MGRVLKKRTVKPRGKPSMPPRRPQKKGMPRSSAGGTGEGFRRIVAHVEDILYSVDAGSDEFVYLSPGFERLLGWTLDDVRRMGGRRAFLSRVIQEGKFEEQERLDREMKASPGPRAAIRCEAWWRCKDGTLKYLEDNWQPAYRRGRLLASDGVLRDLTERRRVEEELRQSEARFLSAFDYAAIGMALVGTDGRWLKVNRALCDLIGYSEQDLLSKTFQDLTHADDLEKDLEYVRQMLAGTIRTYQMEKRYYHKRGHLIWVLLSVSLVRDSEGQPSYFISQIQDITARKEAEAAVRESEERYRLLVEASPDAVTVLRGDRFLYANAAALRLYGAADFAQLAATRVVDTCPPEEVAESTARGKKAMSGEKIPVREHQIVRLDGKRVTVESCGLLIHYRGEMAIQAINRDITERKQAEAALRESEDRYRLLVESSPDAISVQRDGRLLYANPALVRLYGATSLGQLMGVQALDLVPPSDHEATRERYRRAMAGEALPFRETKVRRFDGVEVPIEGILRGVEFHGGRAVLSIVRDISERKRGEQAVRESEARFRTLIEKAPIAIVLSRDEKRIYANKAWFELFGIPETTDIRGTSIADNWTPEWKEKVVEFARRRSVGLPVPVQYEGVCVRADGVPFPVQIAASRLQLADGPATIAFTTDITERKKAEEALAAERERLAVTLRSIGDAVITTDRDGRVVFMNRVAEDLTGWSQDRAAGRSLDEVFHIINEKTGARCEDPVAKVLATGGIVGLANHTALVSRDGVQHIIEDSGAPIRDRESRIIGVVLVFRDVTEKHRMQEEMLRANRLDSLGILAGGIAHDFNNILTIIMGNTSLAMMTAPAQDRLQKQLVETEKACLRAKDLTEQLLTFSKGGTPVRKTASLPDLVRESVDFALRGSPIKCHYGFAQDLWAAEVDPAQISRVFSNLAINSAQAMPSGGDFAVRGRNLELNPGTALPLRPGRYVEISFHDQGIGIPPEHLARVFDPFFTTKQQGSGLGLSICYSVVSRHEGHISVESEMGKGSTFRILLPATGQKPSESAVEAPATKRFRGRLLVMDDEEAVRDVAATMLSALGCEVEVAPEGARAVELYRQARTEGRPFDAVLMDLTVPGGMGGKEATRRILGLDPYARVVASSGYSTDPVMAAPGSHGFRATIAKPYTVPELARVLASVLGS